MMNISGVSQNTFSSKRKVLRGSGLYFVFSLVQLQLLPVNFSYAHTSMANHFGDRSTRVEFTTLLALTVGCWLSAIS